MRPHVIRVLRTMSSERILLQREDGQDCAAVDLHYLRDGSVAGTVFLFEDGGVTDEMAPALLQFIDEALLPEVSLDECNLSFTVVRGHVVGDFQRDRGGDAAADTSR